VSSEDATSKDSVELLLREIVKKFSIQNQIILFFHVFFRTSFTIHWMVHFTCEEQEDEGKKITICRDSPDIIEMQLYCCLENCIVKLALKMTISYYTVTLKIKIKFI